MSRDSTTSMITFLWCSIFFQHSLASTTTYWSSLILNVLLLGSLSSSLHLCTIFILISSKHIIFFIAITSCFQPHYNNTTFNKQFISFMHCYRHTCFSIIELNATKIKIITIMMMTISNLKLVFQFSHNNKLIN